ncbi:SDR family oxidoreductase [Oxalobacteraceae bacterium OTU3REALA1]|nr:SDR family oxidoreductase [Oxalobacteraceae bacterium OTU3REALA1]
MQVPLKKLSEQVMVITGATSGIGLTTARMAADGGARLVLAARNIDALNQLAEELNARGAQALAVPTDVGVRDDVAKLGQAAIDRFGRIDTWVNNAGVSIFGRHEDVTDEDRQRLFQTNFWGVVHGSLEALRRMKRDGGALINVGSEVSDRAVPLQGIYSASKHAVKGFTDSLRMEIEKDGMPISVTLIKPAAIDTMLTVHAKNYLQHEPRLPPPLYAPEVVAGAILHAAQHPQRDVYVGGAAKMIAVGSFHMPRLFDRYMKATMFKQQQSDRPALPDRRDTLYAPDSHELQQRLGTRYSRVHERSPYTAMALRSRPLTTALLFGGAAFAAWKLLARAPR